MAFNKVVTAKSSQTVIDLALQLHGSVDAVFDFLEANPDIESLESDVSGMKVNYELNDTFVQKTYISQGVTVASKPTRYRNTTGPKLLIGEGCCLLINNGYKIRI